MKKPKSIQAAAAVLGLMGGLPAMVNAQQVTTSKAVERVAPDVAGLKSSKIAHLGQLSDSSAATSSAIAMAIAHNRTARAGSSRLASPVAITKVASLGGSQTQAAVSPATGGKSNSLALKAEDFPTQTSRLASHGKLAQQTATSASVASAASLLPTSNKALGNALSSEAAVSKSHIK